MTYKYFPWMLLLAGLFVFRVTAQLVQSIYPLDILPPFQAWHGAAMPYPALVAFQLCVILVMMVVLIRIQFDTIAPRRWKYLVCFGLGGLYFAFMAFRLIAGLSVLSDHPWFSKVLPAYFHLVLAAFILLLGHYIYQKTAIPSSDGDDPVTFGDEKNG